MRDFDAPQATPQHGEAHPNSERNGHAPQVLVTPEDLAQRHDLKRQGANGVTEWHGANPSGHGATRDGFILNADGTSYDRSQERRYTSRETAQLCGIEPEHYAPVAEYQSLNGHANKRASRSGATAREQVFDYHDESVTLLFQAVRRELADGSKKFFQRRRGERGEWVYKLGDARRVLYRLPQVLAASTVYVVEGEKCADALNAALSKAGLLGQHIATTNAGGAGKWSEGYSQVLEGKHVLFLPDNDAPGARHLAAACPSIHAHAASLQVLELPGLPQKGDVCDFFQAGGTLEQVLELAQDAPAWEARAVLEPLGALGSDRGAIEHASDFPALEADGIPAPILTDASGKAEYAPRQIVDLLRPEWDVTALTTNAAHARRIVAYRGDVLAYNARLGWLFYDGRQWQRDDKAASGTSGLVASLSAAVRAEAGELFRHAGTLAKAGRVDHSGALARAARAMLRHAAQVEGAGFIEGALHLSAQSLTVPVERFDQAPWLLGFQNGTWSRGDWRAHQLDDYLLHLSPVKAGREIGVEWPQVLERLTGGDVDFARTLQDVAAYVLSGASHLRALPWLYGPKGTGKSTFAELLQAVLGEMAVSVDPKYLQGDSSRERLGAAIWNKRLAVCAEAGNQRLDAELLKMLSGADSLSVRFLHRESFTVRPRHVLMMVANDAPRIEAHDSALRERVIALPFNHPLGLDLEGKAAPLALTGGPRVEAARSDPASPLARGFAAWALEGLGRLHKTQDIYRAPVVEAACAQFWADTDPITPFWGTVEEADLRQGITRKELRARYERWCEEEGGRPVAAARWNKACLAYGLEETKLHGERFWRLFKPLGAAGAAGARFPKSLPVTTLPSSRGKVGNLAPAAPAAPKQVLEGEVEVSL